MTYIIKMRGGEEFEITEEDRSQILTSRQKVVYLKSIDVSLAIDLIATTYPKSIADEREDRKYQMTGFLHDGTRVKRHFGEWVLANQVVADDSGNDAQIKIDPKFYPEVARDCVPTEKEWNEKYKILPEAERLKLIIENYEIPRLKSGPQSIGQLLKR